jgi:RNA polymerase sigma-70 factor (ECF subfamily)
MNYPISMPDEKLIQFYLNGDPNAMATLVELYKDRVYRSIYNIVQDRYAAEEIFQDVFICLINNMIAGKGAEEGNFLQWATRIAQQLCIEHKRKASQAIVLNATAEKVGFTVSAAMPETNYHDNHGKIKSMIDMLPDTQREVMLLNHYCGLSFNEIAEIMKCSVSMALDCMKLALNNLCKMMTERTIALN